MIISIRFVGVKIRQRSPIIAHLRLLEPIIKSASYEAISGQPLDSASDCLCLLVKGRIRVAKRGRYYFFCIKGSYVRMLFVKGRHRSHNVNVEFKNVVCGRRINILFLH